MVIVVFVVMLIVMMLIVMMVFIVIRSGSIIVSYPLLSNLCKSTVIKTKVTLAVS